MKFEGQSLYLRRAISNYKPTMATKPDHKVDDSPDLELGKDLPVQGGAGPGMAGAGLGASAHDKPEPVSDSEGWGMSDDDEPIKNPTDAGMGVGATFLDGVLDRISGADPVISNVPKLETAVTTLHGRVDQVEETVTELRSAIEGPREEPRSSPTPRAAPAPAAAAPAPTPDPRLDVESAYDHPAYHLPPAPPPGAAPTTIDDLVEEMAKYL